MDYKLTSKTTTPAVRGSGRIQGRIETFLHSFGGHLQGTWILLLLLLSCYVTAGDKLHVKEYCETEIFNATCASDEIILISHARYGRMRVGRCVKLDYGHVGCAADVLDIADTQCSGKRQCIMPIPDTQLANTKPCPDDLKPYFEATYLCVKVPVPSPGNCLYEKYMTLKSLPGYLSNTRSVTAECGTIPDSPWKIEVRPGQRINLTLYEFSHDKSDDNKCRTYAIVRERSLGRTRNVTLCTIDRQRLVYTSITHSLEIGLANNIPTNFIIKYEAVGCPDIKLPPLAKSSLKGDTLTIVCNNTRETWQLKCADNEWLGHMANCSAIAAVRPPTESPIHEKKALPYGSSVLIIVAVALTIGLFVLLLGLCCFTRHRQKLCYMEENSHNEEKEEEAERIYSHTQWASRPERCFEPNGPGAIFLTEDTETDFSHARVGDIHSHTPLLTQTSGSIYTSAMHPKCTCPHRRGVTSLGGVNYGIRDTPPGSGGGGDGGGGNEGEVSSGPPSRQCSTGDNSNNSTQQQRDSSQSNRHGHQQLQQQQQFQPRSSSQPQGGNSGMDGIYNTGTASKLHPHRHHHVHFDPDVISDQSRALYSSFKKPVDNPQTMKTDGGSDRNELYPLCVISQQSSKIPS